jgi:hypothetical protein
MSRLGLFARSLTIVAMLAQGCSGTPDTAPGEPSGNAPVDSNRLSPADTEPSESLPALAGPLHLGVAEDPVIGGTFGGGWYTRLYTGVAVGSRFIVGGERILSEDGPVEAVIWTSDDGTSWTPASARDDAFQDARVSDLVTNGDVILALGDERHSVDDEDDPLIRVVWRSADGLVWDRLEAKDPDIPRLPTAGVLGHDDGFMVWGKTYPPKEQGVLIKDSILVSQSGTDWTLVNSPAFDESEILDVARSTNGYVAVGDSTPCIEDDCSVMTDGPARAWWSADGVTWEPADLEPGERLFGVYPLADGMFAVGTPEPEGVVPTWSHWHSDDGRSWSIVEEGQDFRRAIASDGLRVILWDRPAPDFSNTGPGVMRASTDGISWDEIGTVDTGDLNSDGFIIGANGILVLLSGFRGENLDAGVLFVPFA